MGKNKTLEKKVVISLRKSTSPATHKYTLAHIEECSLQCMAAAIHRHPHTQKHPIFPQMKI